MNREGFSAPARIGILAAVCALLLALGIATFSPSSHAAPQFGRQ